MFFVLPGRTKMSGGKERPDVACPLTSENENW